MENQSPSPSINRREFLGLSCAALFAGVLIQITGCGSSSTYSNSNLGPGDKQGTVGPPAHGHAAILRKAVLDAGGGVDLHIMGSATHDHVVSLTVDEMTSIKNGGTVAKESSVTDAHSHTVTFN